MAQDGDGIQQGAHGGGRIERAKSVQVGQGADRSVDHGADAVDELDVNADARQWRRDVGEDDHRIHTQAGHRLEAHLGTQGRVADDVRQARAFPDLAVLRQGTTSLAHEPDRGHIDPFAMEGAEQPIGP